MHSIDRTDTDNDSNIIGSFAIVLLTIAIIGCLFYLVGQYPKAYPSKQIVKLNSQS